MLVNVGLYNFTIYQVGVNFVLDSWLLQTCDFILCYEHINICYCLYKHKHTLEIIILLLSYERIKIVIYVYYYLVCNTAYITTMNISS